MPSRPSASQTASLSLFSPPKNHIQTERQRVLKAFHEMRGVLAEGTQKLEEGELDVLGNWVAAKDQLGQQRQNMREQISSSRYRDH